MAFKGAAATESERHRAIDEFEAAVTHYQTWLNTLQKRADLPTRGYVAAPEGA